MLEREENEDWSLFFFFLWIIYWNMTEYEENKLWALLNLIVLIQGSWRFYFIDFVGVFMSDFYQFL